MGAYRKASMFVCGFYIFLEASNALEIFYFTIKKRMMINIPALRQRILNVEENSGERKPNLRKMFNELIGGTQTNQDSSEESDSEYYDFEQKNDTAIMETIQKYNIKNEPIKAKTYIKKQISL